MKILELNFERTWRGGERQTIYNMLGFRTAGVSVSLLCRKGYPLEAKAKAEGFDVFSFSNIFGAFFFMIVKGRQFNVFHAQSSHILTWCLLSKPFHRAKIILSRRVDFVPKGVMTKLKYRLTDKIVAVSEAVKKIVESFSGREAIVISDIAVPVPLDGERALGFLTKQKIDSGKRIIGTTAALVPHKDPLNMVEAIKLLSDKRADFVFLHFGNGELERAVKEKIEEYGLKDVYKLMGFVERVEDFFSVFEVFVMSSEEEGLGSSVLDAFLYTVPVVATDAGGLAELLQDGRGILCRKKKPTMLADAIDVALQQPELCSKITETALTYVQKEHSLEAITDRYLKLLN
ncbi:MAG: glycosyltransferase family 4 protein [Bacteriovorax sp.]